MNLLTKVVLRLCWKLHRTFIAQILRLTRAFIWFDASEDVQKTTCRKGSHPRSWDESELKEVPDVTLRGSRVQTPYDVWDTDGKPANRHYGACCHPSSIRES
jgi:hypothetical protein